MPLISLEKNYRTRNGYKVTILDILPDQNEVFLYYRNEDKKIIYYICDCQGNLIDPVPPTSLDTNKEIQESDFDLIEITPYDDLKRDDKVKVYSKNGFFIKKAHFACLSFFNKPQIYKQGWTSFTNESQFLETVDHVEKVD